MIDHKQELTNFASWMFLILERVQDPHEADALAKKYVNLYLDVK